MVTTPKFCSSCGSPLSPGTRFCANCGTPAQAAPAAPAPAAGPAPTPPPSVVQVSISAPASAPAEPIVGIISLQRRKGLMGMGTETFNMIVTPRRLALVAVSNQTMQEAVVAARDQAKAEGKGIFGQMGAQMGWLKVLYRRYQEVPIDVSLAQSPGSFVLLNQEVRSIRLKDPAIVQVGPQRQQSNQTEMTIETGGGKQKWELVTMKAREAREILQQTLGGVVR